MRKLQLCLCSQCNIILRNQFHVYYWTLNRQKVQYWCSKAAVYCIWKGNYLIHENISNIQHYAQFQEHKLGDFNSPTVNKFATVWHASSTAALPCMLYKIHFFHIYDFDNFRVGSSLPNQVVTGIQVLLSPVSYSIAI